MRLRAIAQSHGSTGTLKGHVGVLLVSYISVDTEQNSQEKLNTQIALQAFKDLKNIHSKEHLRIPLHWEHLNSFSMSKGHLLLDESES